MQLLSKARPLPASAVQLLAIVAFLLCGASAHDLDPASVEATSSAGAAEAASPARPGRSLLARPPVYVPGTPFNVVATGA